MTGVTLIKAVAKVRSHTRLPKAAKVLVASSEDIAVRAFSQLARLPEEQAAAAARRLLEELLDTHGSVYLAIDADGTFLKIRRKDKTVQADRERVVVPLSMHSAAALRLAKAAFKLQEELKATDSPDYYRFEINMGRGEADNMLSLGYEALLLGGAVKGGMKSLAEAMEQFKVDVENANEAADASADSVTDANPLTPPLPPPAPPAPRCLNPAEMRQIASGLTLCPEWIIVSTPPANMPVRTIRVSGPYSDTGATLRAAVATAEARKEEEKLAPRAFVGSKDKDTPWEVDDETEVIETWIDHGDYIDFWSYISGEAWEAGPAAHDLERRFGEWFEVRRRTVVLEGIAGSALSDLDRRIQDFNPLLLHPLHFQLAVAAPAALYGDYKGILEAPVVKTMYAALLSANEVVDPEDSELDLSLLHSFLAQLGVKYDRDRFWLALLRQVAIPGTPQKGDQLRKEQVDVNGLSSAKTSIRFNQGARVPSTLLRCIRRAHGLPCATKSQLFDVPSVYDLYRTLGYDLKGGLKLSSKDLNLVSSPSCGVPASFPLAHHLGGPAEQNGTFVEPASFGLPARGSLLSREAKEMRIGGPRDALADEEVMEEEGVAEDGVDWGGRTLRWEETRGRLLDDEANELMTDAWTRRDGAEKRALVSSSFGGMEKRQAEAHRTLMLDWRRKNVKVAQDAMDDLGTLLHDSPSIRNFNSRTNHALSLSADGSKRPNWISASAITNWSEGPFASGIALSCDSKRTFARCAAGPIGRVAGGKTGGWVVGNAGEAFPFVAEAVSKWKAGGGMGRFQHEAGFDLRAALESTRSASAKGEGRARTLVEPILRACFVEIGLSILSEAQSNVEELIKVVDDYEVPWVTWEREIRQACLLRGVDFKLHLKLSGYLASWYVWNLKEESGSAADFPSPPANDFVPVLTSKPAVSCRMGDSVSQLRRAIASALQATEVYTTLKCTNLITYAEQRGLPEAWSLQ